MKNIKVCGKKYYCKEIEATTWCGEEFPCPKCLKRIEEERCEK